MRRNPYPAFTVPLLVTAALILVTVSAPMTAVGQTGETLINLDADSTSVNAVLQILAARSGLNIVTSPEVQQRRISIHLRNTPFDEALNLVVRAAGLGYERVGNSILVADNTTLSSPTGLVTRVFDLEYANAADVQAMLSVVSEDVAANVSGDRLVVRANQSILEQVEAVIREVDRKPGQVLLEARLIEVNTTALQELGIDWEKITKWSTVIAEGPANPSAPGELPTTLEYLKSDQTKDVYRQTAAFQVTIDLLLTDGMAKLLSHSTVVALDNTPAEIFAGETVPVVITSLQNPGGAGGVLQTVQLEKIDVGVKLAITPRISGDGYITTLIQPEVSRIIAFVGPDDDLPQTSTRRTSNLVRVRDGEKIYIGGLLLDETRQTVKKVPLLGDIPLIGYLFRHYRNEEQHVDLVIEVTPRIVGDEAGSLPIPPVREEER